MNASVVLCLLDVCYVVFTAYRAAPKWPKMN